MIGRRVAGRYELLELLGRGATAEVYRARDETLRIDVAIKILAPHLGRDAEAIERFRHELEAAREVHCPAVAQVFDLGRDGELSFLVLEYGRRGTLKDHLLLEGSLSPELLDLLMESVAEALAACHARGILHRDLKPSNVLFDPERREVKLIDFGVARIADRGLGDLGGSVVGTPEYMAPEQFDDPIPDPRSDLYAAGVLFFEAATGRPPVTGRTIPELARKHHEPLALGPRALNPKLAEGAERVILRLLARDPGERFQTADELRETLAGATTVAPLDDAAARREAAEARCPLCSARLALGLPFCPTCGGDLSSFSRFGRWSVVVTGEPDAGQARAIARVLDASLPASARRRRGTPLDERPLRAIECASEELARFVAAALRRDGIMGLPQFLSLPRVLGFLALACLTLRLLGAWQRLPDLLGQLFGQLARGGLSVFELATALQIALLLAVPAWCVFHLRRRLSGIAAYISPLDAEPSLAAPLARARACQRELTSPRLRALGAGLLTEAALLAWQGRLAARDAELLQLGYDALRALDRQLAALGTLAEPRRVTLLRQDAVLRGSQSLLRIGALWRRNRAARVRQATRRLRLDAGELAAHEARLGEAREELAELLAALDALAAPPLRAVPA